MPGIASCGYPDASGNPPDSHFLADKHVARQDYCDNAMLVDSAGLFWSFDLRFSYLNQNSEPAMITA